MGKGSAPPPPDYEAAAVAQGTANRETAMYNTGANRVNQYTPQGSSTWSMRPGADPNNPQPGDYIQTTALSPDQQRQYDETNRISESLLGTAGRQLSLVDKTFSTPLDLSGLPAWRTMGKQPDNGPPPPQMQMQPPQGGSGMAPGSFGGAPQASEQFSTLNGGGSPQNMEAVLSAMLAASGKGR